MSLLKEETDGGLADIDKLLLLILGFISILDFNNLGFFSSGIDGQVIRYSTPVQRVPGLKL